MKQKDKPKYALIRHAYSISESFMLVLAVLIVLSIIGVIKHESGVWFMVGCTVMFAVVWILAMRRSLFLMLCKAIFTDTELKIECMGRKLAAISWHECSCVYLMHYRTKDNIYDECWICFSKESKSSDIAKTTPLPSNDCVFIAYTEVVWDDISKYLDSNIYLNAIAESLEIE